MDTPAYWRHLKVVRSTVSDSVSTTNAITANGWTLLPEHCTYSDDGNVRLVFGRQDRLVPGPR